MGGRSVFQRRNVLELLAAVVPATVARAEPIRTFTIGTGDPSGTYYPIGGLIAEIVSAPPGGDRCRAGELCGVPGLVAVAQTSAGSVANLEGLASGRFDSAFCQADVAFEAWQGGGVFAAEAFSGLRALASLYPEVAQLVLLDGHGARRIAVGSPRSGTHLTASVVLPALGIEPPAIERLPLNTSAALAAMAAGDADGFLTVAGLPTTAVAEALALPDVHLIGADVEAARAMVLERPHWRLTAIAAGVYGQPRPVASVAVPSLWLVRDDLDAELAYALVEALWAPTARAVLDAGHPAGQHVTPLSALTGLSVPLHPGAERFYREVGLLAGAPAPPPSAN